jgi:polyisoprenoid-binding protein YceI
MQAAARQALIGLIAILVAVVSGTAPAPAWATKWAVAPDQSRILFDYERNRQKAEGSFARFSGTGVFDRDAPGEATLEFRIDSSSIDLDDVLASAFAASAEWFDSANHPQVIYRLSKLTPIGGDNFHAIGELTIRGRTLPIETTITLDIGFEEAKASGSLRLNRMDYLLGVGPSALFVDIGTEVAVRFELTAHPVR